MRNLLHIISRPEAELARQIIERESAQAGAHSEVVDLNTGEPDYTALVEKIFAADSVQVW